MNELEQSIRTNNWAAIIQECQGSGQTIKQWCTENNISEGAYYYRLRQLREKLLQEHWGQTPLRKNIGVRPL